MNNTSIEINNKKNIREKIISLFLGFFFSLIILELLLRLIGFIDNLDRDSIGKNHSQQFKILTLGNSYTAGAGAPEGQSYPAQLQKMFDKEELNRYQVINRGRGNVNSTYILEHLPEWLKEDRPQVVFVMTGEPNRWNKYGFSQFVESYKPENESYISWDFLRWSKIFRLIELFVHGDEDLLFGSNSKYSTFFKNLKLEEKNKAQIGYFWLGILQVSTQREFISLEEAQTNEAIEHLEYIFNKDKNALAASILAQLYYTKKYNTEKFIYYNEKAAKYSPHFNLSIFIRMNGFENSINYKYKERYLAARKTLENLPKELPLDVLMSWVKHPFTKKFNSIEEENDFLLKIYTHNPSDMKIGEKLFRNNADPLKIFNAVEVSLRLNPLSPIADLYKFASEVAKAHPSLKPKVEKLFEDLSIVLNDENFKKIFVTNELESAWITHDLNKIIKIIKDSGAHVVVQTYPPYRKNIERFADVVLRSWWGKRKQKSDIEFMDVGLMLNEKFDERNGGDKYFSQEYGPSDNHQSTLGNIEIATLMVPYVLKFEGRGPKAVDQ